MLDVLSDPPAAGMVGDLLVGQVQGHGVVAGAHGHLLGGEAPGDRVAVAVERDAEHLGDAGGFDVVGVERGGGHWLEQPLLLVGEDERGDLAGDFVHAAVGEVVAPRGGLGVEVEQVAEATAGPEAGAHEADRSLDASLLVALADVAGADGEATGSGVLEELRIELRREGGVRQDDGLHVVEDVDGRGAAEEDEAALHASQQRAQALAQRELDVHLARVAEHGHERAYPSRDTGQREAEVGPVDLHGFAGGEVQSQERLGRLAIAAKLTKPGAQDRNAAGVAQRAQSLQHGGRQNVRYIVEDGPQLRLVRVQQRAASRRRLGRRGGVPAEDLAHRLARHR